MENASKALLIAGSILIAVILVTLLVRTYGNMGLFQRQQLSEQEALEIQEFNQRYTKYQNQYVYGTDVITVINQCLNEDSAVYPMKVEVHFVPDGGTGYYTFTEKRYNRRTGKTTTRTVKVYSRADKVFDNRGDTLEFIDGRSAETRGRTAGDDDDNQEVDSIKGRAFLCDDIEYNNQGRVIRIHFTEKQFNSNS